MPIRIRRGNLTVKGNGGTIEETENNKFGAIVVKSNGAVGNTNHVVLNVEDGVTLKGWSGLFVDCWNGTSAKHAYGVKINFNGNIDSPAQIDHTEAGNAIYVNGNIQNTTNAPEITLGVNTTVTARKEKSCAIYAAGYAKWTIQGGSYTGANCIEIKAGTMDIADGTFEATATPSHTANSNGTSTTGYALAAVNNPSYADGIVVTITGGTFTGGGGIAKLVDFSGSTDSITLDDNRQKGR